MRRVAPLLAAVFIASPAIASYHYIHYNGRTAPYVPIYEKFNLAALPNNTVTFFVSDQGPAVFGNNDSFGSVLSQIKQATAAWNSISSSDLRVSFGGLETYGAGGPLTNPNTPGGDVIFTDLPGVFGMGAPTISTTPVPTAGGGSFFPIVRGVVMLSRDTAREPGPSYMEGFFATAVHEMGHAIGLQHTWTGSAMSQGVIRNTSRARPLDADDIAAVSILYGKPNWQANYGAISGRVTYANGQPAALASVVAIAAAGPAVSTLTDPNGVYRIEGLPPIYNYSIYVHPLPPGATLPANLRVPEDLARQPFAATGPFQTVFYPGTLDPAQATAISVAAGNVVPGVNFTVQARPAAATYDIVTYAYLNTTTRAYINTGDRLVTPAYVNSSQPLGLIIAKAAAPSFLPNPQTLTILGGLAPAVLNAPRVPTILPYESGTIAAYFDVPSWAGTGPRHLVFQFANDIYVLPNGVTLVPKSPPQVTSVSPNADGSVTITGAGFGLDSVIYFDGVQAAVRIPVNGTDALSTVTVVPPQGVSGQTATITAYNTDGQNSMLLQGEAPPTYTYPAAPAPLIGNVSLTALPAATSAMVEITGINTNFIDGQVTLGFGSNDVVVRRVWVTSPTRLLANVLAPPGATLGASQISVISGLAVLPQAGSFQIQAARPGQPSLNLPVVSADPAHPAIHAGSTAVISGQNLAISPTAAIATLNDFQVPIIAANANQISFLVPSGFPAGPAVLRLNNGAVAAFPVIVQIDSTPPDIAGINNASGAQLPGISVAAGELLNALVTGIDAAAATPGRVRVQVSGVEMPVQQIVSINNRTHQIQFMLTQSFGGAHVPVTISVDGSASAAFSIIVR